MIDDTQRPDSEPEFDEPVFKPDDPSPVQLEPEISSDSGPNSAVDSQHSDNEPEFGEQVFTPGEPAPEQLEPGFSSRAGPDVSVDTDPSDGDPEFGGAITSPDEPELAPSEPDFSLSPEPEPGFLSELETHPPDLDAPRPGADELVFAADGYPVDSADSDPYLDSPAISEQPAPAEMPAYEAVSDDEPAFEPVVEGFEEQDDAGPQAGTGWVNIQTDAEMTAEPAPEKEYALFDETPAADVATTTPAGRRLGRTGPVWVIGGIALVVIVALGWLAVSRLSGPSDDVSLSLSEPAVQQVEAAPPTAVPPTATPATQPTATLVRLPVGANVTVGDTDGQGVKLRADPGLYGELLDIVEEGMTLVVMEAAPEDTQYPVEEDGYLWYRMRVPDKVDAAGNPLMGWSASEFFEVEGQ